VLVFVSYRRRDSAFAAQALRYALRATDHEVFLDTGTIAPGEAFREVIRDGLQRSSLVLALVGPEFDPGRLHEPLDAVAFEWRQARFLGCAVHAVLLDGAAMPASLATIRRLNCALGLRSSRRIAASINSSFSRAPSPRWLRCRFSEVPDPCMHASLTFMPPRVA